MLRAVRRALGFAWTYLPRPLVVQLVLGTALALLPATQVVLISRITDAIAAGRRGDALLLLVLTALSVGLASALSDLESSAWRTLAFAVGGEMNAFLAQRQAGLTPAQVADPEWSARGQEARDSIQAYGTWYLNGVVGAAQGLIAAVSLVAALWGTSVPAALLIVVSLVPILVAYLVVSAAEDRMFTEETRLSRRARYLHDQITYQRTATELISLGSAPRVAGWVARDLRLKNRAQLSVIRYQSMVMIVGGAVTTVALGAALWFVTLGPSGSLGGAAAGVVAVLSAAAVMRSTGYSVGTLMAHSGPLLRFFDFLDEAGGHEVTLVEPAPVAELRADGLAYSYPGADREALRGAVIVARRGEMVALVGANGAGKTTLVNLVLGALTPSTGHVRLDGRDLADLTAGERLATFSLLTQEFGRYELAVRDAVLLGTPSDDVADDDVWAALELARAAEFVRALPDGLDTQLGQQWGGVGLSGGQWQRLALARIALRGAPIWLLDEPTSAVDAETEAEIFDDLGRRRAERITVVVSHRAWTLRGMDRIYVLDEGRVVQVGTYAELMAVDGRFRDMFRQQADDPEPVPAEDGEGGDGSVG